jgi:hypothetical protein
VRMKGFKKHLAGHNNKSENLSLVSQSFWNPFFQPRVLLKNAMNTFSSCDSYFNQKNQRRMRTFITLSLLFEKKKHFSNLFT